MDGYGIIRYDGWIFILLIMVDGFCDNIIYDLMVDCKGNLWIGIFWGGVFKYDG